MDTTAQQDFLKLKQTMCTTLVLALQDFTKPFVVECDASGTSIGAVLTKEGRPLAFTSLKSSGIHFRQSTYEKEMMVILYLVNT